ncbi:MAG: FKBP-type peptidyl-prolyl cis-trans isomerase N-terminal domain-containing protein [Chthoniobacteraceae bacterium]
MKLKTWLAMGALLLPALFLIFPAGKAGRPTLKDPRERVSYAFGMSAGASLKNTYGPLDPGVIGRGIKDSLGGRTLRLAPAEIEKTLRGAALANIKGDLVGNVTGSFFGRIFGSFGSEREKRSYAAGANLGGMWRLLNADLAPEIVVLGIEDAWAGYTAVMNEAEARAETERFGREWQLRQAEERRKQGEKNLVEGNAFLASNRQRKGVSVLPTGLQYKVLKTGSGASPSFDSFVEIKYRGTKLDGSVFEDTGKYPKPVIASVAGIIRGWADALQAMKPGDKWQIYLPPDDAYGFDGNGGSVGPNETVVFDLELVKILPSGKDWPPADSSD